MLHVSAVACDLYKRLEKWILDLQEIDRIIQKDICRRNKYLIRGWMCVIDMIDISQRDLSAILKRILKRLHIKI